VKRRPPFLLNFRRRTADLSLVARMDWDRARRRERVPVNPYAGEDYTVGLNYWIVLDEIQPALTLLAGEGHDEVERRIKSVCASHVRHGILPAALVLQALNALPTTALEAVVATASRGFGRSNARMLRTLARHALGTRRDQ